MGMAKIKLASKPAKTPAKRRGVFSRLTIAAAGALIVAAPVPGAAGDWDLDMKFTQEVLHDDNLFLEQNVSDEVFGAITKVKAGYTRSTPKSETGIEANLAASEYWGDLENNRPNDLDRLDPSLFVRHQRRGPTSQLSLKAGFERQGTRDAELDDSGRLVANGERETITASGSFMKAISRTNQFGAQASFRDVSYNISNLVDYRVYDFAAVWSRDFDQRNELKVVAGVRRLETNRNIGEQDDIVYGTVGLNTQHTERLKTEIYIGAIQVYGNDIDTVIVGARDDEALNLIFGGALRYRQSQRLTLTLRTDRSVVPSSTGLTQESWLTSSEFSYRLSPSIRTQLDLVYLRREDLFGTASSEREYYEISPKLIWEVGKSWDVFARYRRRSQVFDVWTDWATSDQFLIGVSARYPVDK